VFQTVFVLVWHTVLFGLLAGLMLIPIILSVVGGSVHQQPSLRLLGVMDADARALSARRKLSTTPRSAHSRRHNLPMA
jgi:hypothetical protein